MIILHDDTAAADPALLDACWNDPATFAFAPAKSSVADDWIRARLEALPEDLRTDHFALLTSGSTGRPKLVVGQRARAERLARVLHAAQESEPVAGTVVALPLSYCYAFVNQWVWSRVHRRRLVVTAGLAEPDRLRDALLGTERSMLCLVGAQVGLLLAYLGEDAFPQVIRVHFAGGRFPQERLPALRRLFPNATVFNNYGCTEAMPRLTLRRADAAASARAIGRPLPGIELSSGPGGRLRFRSPYGAVAAVDDHGLHRFGDGWIESGDLAEPAADGGWLLQGRANEVFKRYGEKVSLPSILETVATHWSGAVSSYREVDALGEEGYVLVLAPPADPAQVRTLLRALRAHHPRAQWPLRIESVPEMPTLPNSKIDRIALATLPGTRIEWNQRIG